MKSAFILAMALYCVTSAHAQQQATPPAPPAPVVDENALAGTSARASKVIGAKIYRGDNAVGEIKDVLLDLNKATVPAVIISVGGLLGINEKQVAVQPEMIKVGKEARFTIDMTEDQLKAAPAFDPGKVIK